MDIGGIISGSMPAVILIAKVVLVYILWQFVKKFAVKTSLCVNDKCEKASKPVYYGLLVIGGYVLLTILGVNLETIVGFVLGLVTTVWAAILGAMQGLVLIFAGSFGLAYALSGKSQISANKLVTHIVTKFTPQDWDSKLDNMKDKFNK